MTVEILSPEAAAIHIAEWQRLAADCLEPNIFLDPGFALAAARHLAKHCPPRFLFVWDGETPGQGALIGVCPLASAGPFSRWFPTRIWTHEQAPLGTPLLDRMRAAEALTAIFAYCRTHLPQVAGLMFPMLPQEGAVASLLTTSAAADHREIKIFGAHQRASLSAGHEPQSYLDHVITSVRRRKLRRAHALLEAHGSVTFRVQREPGEIMDATEAFLALEAKGWKGRRGTAFLKSPERAAFAREVVSTLAGEGKYFFARLDLDGKPLAMALILEAGGRAYWWKITYDETFAAYSPGVLLTLDLTRILLADAKITFTDSCASANHPMIDHIWSERLAIADFLIAVEADTPRAFAALAGCEWLRRVTRNRLKEIVLRLRRWKRALSQDPS
jgi:CelD/BcsL family acetyltransferase involved in cellulose biosynthesis